MRPNVTDLKLEYPNFANDFKKHLNDPLNSRILFTAPFGSGKSTFLREFFESDKGTEYVTIKLYPVHYAVATNEDVFELIKFDILSELLIRYPELIEEEKEKFSTALKAQVFLLQHKGADNFVGSIVSVASKTGKSLIDILTAIKKLKLDFKQFETEIDRPEYKSLEDYLNRFSEQQGGVHEMDDVSHHIFKLLARLKESDSEQQQRKTVLIIDDLDRLDPEHIFRLFNIFSAHYDSVTEQNKFGFDNVIFVCDIQNIKRMYFHRYGKGVDFSGYMDKFYSSRPFQFDSKFNVINQIDRFLMLKPLEGHEKIIKSLESGSSFGAYRRLLMISLIYSDCISLRTLDQSKPYTVRDVFNLEPSGSRYAISYPSTYVPFLLLVDYLRSFTPDLDQLRANLQYLAEFMDEKAFASLFSDHANMDRLSKALLSDCLTFLLPKSIVFNDDYLSQAEKETTYYFKIENNGNDLYLAYNLRELGEMYVRLRKPWVLGVKTKQEEDAPAGEINIFSMMVYTFDKCVRNGIIIKY